MIINNELPTYLNSWKKVKKDTKKGKYSHDSGYDKNFDNLFFLILWEKPGGVNSLVVLKELGK